MGRVDRNWAKSGGRLLFSWPGFSLVGELGQVPHYPEEWPFPVGYLHRTGSPGIKSGRHTHASVYIGSLRCWSSNGDRRWRQLALSLPREVKDTYTTWRWITNEIEFN